MICPRCKKHTYLLLLTEAGQMCRPCKAEWVRKTPAAVDPEMAVQERDSWFVIGTLLFIFAIAMLVASPVLLARRVKRVCAAAWYRLTRSTVCAWCEQEIKRPIIATPRTHLNVTGSICTNCRMEIERDFSGRFNDAPERFQSQLP